MLNFNNTYVDVLTAMGIFEYQEQPEGAEVTPGSTLDGEIGEITMANPDVQSVSVVNNGAGDRTNLVITIPYTVRNSLGITEDHHVLVKPISDDTFLVRRP